MAGPAHSLADVLAVFEALARDAGAAILTHYETECRLADKSDTTPLTAADLAADEIIWAGLHARLPGIPVVTEERAESHGAALDGDGWHERFILVDPLDGTKEFISGNGQFTVNIALVEDGRPVAGVVFAPALDRMFIGATGAGAYEVSGPTRTALNVRPAPDARVAVASRSHRSPETDTFLAANTITDCVSAGSSLKFCLVAAGEADIYPRMGPTMEWDTAAGQAVLEAAGGVVLAPDGSPFHYGKRSHRNGDFIALGDRRQRLVLPLAIWV
ncbi:MAG: 3'(2'),5'-bisphosphate nucleotidase CysQ [Rhizobiaceae bacterium]|jgi:3'(2'),5'-bisphosphate nucleotidase|nr:3'(2'),5'-bisphosphate nucleotidase CysQ [Rhizobiaceae bacterium]